MGRLQESESNLRRELLGLEDLPIYERKALEACPAATLPFGTTGHINPATFLFLAEVVLSKAIDLIMLYR